MGVALPAGARVLFGMRNTALSTSTQYSFKGELLILKQHRKLAMLQNYHRTHLRMPWILFIISQASRQWCWCNKSNGRTRSD